MPGLTDTLKNVAKDGFYIALGFGVINFQKAQVRRQELKKEISRVTETLKPAVKQTTETLSSRLIAVNKTLSDSEGQIVKEITSLPLLPESVKDAINSGYEKASSFRTTVVNSLVNGLKAS